MKKLICIFLCILMIASAAPLNAFAEVTQTSGGYQDKMTWEYDKGTKTLTVECDGPLDFPYEDVYGYLEGPYFMYRSYPWNVNGINGEAEHIVFKGNITEIGDYVFFYFSKLKELNIPSTVTKIGVLAFSRCGFEEVEVPATVKRIESSAFSNCYHLKKVTLNEGLEYIGDYAFYSSNLEKINIPKSVKMTGGRIFGDIFSISIKKLAQEYSGFYYIDDCIVDCSRGVESSFIRDGTRFVPESLFYTIGAASLKRIYIPSSVKAIGSKAFAYLSLESVTIADGVESIGESAFENNYKLTSLSIGDGVSQIGKKAFYGTGITTLKLPAGLERIEEQSFGNTKLTALNIPKNIKWIAADAFDGTPVEKVSVAADSRYFTADNNVLFSKNKASLVYYPKEKPGKHYMVPSGVKYIYSDFNATKLQTVTLPKSVAALYRPINKTLYYFGSQSAWDKVKGNQSAKVCRAKLSKTRYTYNGKKRKPKVLVYDGAGNLLEEKRAYTVTYPKGRKKINDYTVKVKLKGYYKGEILLDFRIAPKKTAITKITKGGGMFTAKWKKVKKNISGYEIQLSTSEKFTYYSTKTYTVKKNKVRKSFEDLSVNKPYYVRIRTFKTVNKKRIYSAWSKAKKVTVTSPY